ncbi:putative sensor histidine kinase TcrY domain protein [Mycobacterium intracellulare]|nr:putative sensor histidine kinase TcrY domain protein [Mycobacterium intracellulare]
MVGQIVVLAIVCVGITAVTELALNHHLVKQLDGQLAGTSFRSALMYPEPNHPGWHHHQHSYYPRPGPGPRFLDAPGQPAGMVAAVVSHGKTVDAGYLTSSGTRDDLTPTAQTQLEQIAGNRAPVTLNLDGLGRYRVVAAPSRNGSDIIVTGLSMSNIDATLIRMLVIFGIVTAVALAAATIAGVVIIRRALAPLRRVAQTAARSPICRCRAARSNCLCAYANPTRTPPPRWDSSVPRSTGCSTTSRKRCRRARPARLAFASSSPTPAMNCARPWPRSAVIPN